MTTTDLLMTKTKTFSLVYKNFNSINLSSWKMTPRRNLKCLIASAEAIMEKSSRQGQKGKAKL